MGINSMRAASPVVFLVTVVVCSLILSVAAQRQGDCTARVPDGRVLGQCVPIRQCDFFMTMLAAPVVTEGVRNLIRQNQCNIQEDGSINVCCPLNSQPGKDGLGALRHPLLPVECGVANWKRVNRTDTNIKEYPWMALIEYSKPSQEKLHACGGVLISDRYVLTAAHCVSGPAISSGGWTVQAVRLGEWDTMTNPDCQVNSVTSKAECAPPYQDVPIEESIAHPLYNKEGASQTNDIAIIRLGSSVKFSDFVHPICLPDKQLRADELEGLEAEVAGWQVTSSTRMKKSDVTIESIESCQSKYAARNVNLKVSQLCAAANSNECHGNSGGPLMVFKNNGYILGGLLSFGPVPCPSAGWSDVYTRVASYIEWIHDNLKE